MNFSTGFLETVIMSSTQSTGHILEDKRLAIPLFYGKKNKDNCTETSFQLYMHACIWLYHMYIISVCIYLFSVHIWYCKYDVSYIKEVLGHVV